MKHEHIGPWNRNWPQWGGLWKPLGWYNEYDLVLEGEMKLGLAQGGWGIAEALEGGCVKASWYYTYLWKKFHMSEHDYRNYRIEYINISKLRTMESDGGLEYIVDLVWKRLVLKRMMNVKKYDLYRVGKEIETSVLKEYGYEVGDFSEDFWNEEMVRTIHFVNDRRSVWTERDERYMRFVDKGLKWSYLSDFGKFVLEQIATREDWDRVNLIMEFYKLKEGIGEKLMRECDDQGNELWHIEDMFRRTGLKYFLLNDYDYGGDEDLTDYETLDKGFYFEVLARIVDELVRRE